MPPKACRDKRWSMRCWTLAHDVDALNQHNLVGVQSQAAAAFCRVRVARRSAVAFWKLPSFPRTLRGSLVAQRRSERLCSRAWAGHRGTAPSRVPLRREAEILAPAQPIACCPGPPPGDLLRQQIFIGVSLAASAALVASCCPFSSSIACNSCQTLDSCEPSSVSPDSLISTANTRTQRSARRDPEESKGVGQRTHRRIWRASSARRGRGRSPCRRRDSRASRR